MRSATMIVVTFVATDGMSGRTDAVEIFRIVEEVVVNVGCCAWIAARQAQSAGRLRQRHGPGEHDRAAPRKAPPLKMKNARSDA